MDKRAFNMKATVTWICEQEVHAFIVVVEKIYLSLTDRVWLAATATFFLWLPRFLR